MSALEEKLKQIPPVQVLDTSKKEYIPIDISTNNETLRSIDVSSSTAWDQYIHKYLKKHHADVAYGGYLERRDIYSRSTYFKSDDEEERNIHLGIDLWTQSGTNVLAPLAGTVHSFKNNKNYGDYGPTIVLKHTVDHLSFYTLYGHLSMDSLQGLEEGMQISKGQVIGSLGEAAVNGDYAPHLHFQLILDMEDHRGDYPGVCSEKMKNFYARNCPDPNILLKLPI